MVVLLQMFAKVNIKSRLMIHFDKKQLKENWYFKGG